MKLEHSYKLYFTTNYKRKVLYVGVTNNLARRLVEHYANQGKANTFAGKYRAHHLIYWEHFQHIKDAIAREKELKKWNRKRKEELIATKNPEWKFYNVDICKEWPPEKLWKNYLEAFKKQTVEINQIPKGNKNIYLYQKDVDDVVRQTLIPENIIPQESTMPQASDFHFSQKTNTPKDSLYDQGMKTRRSVLGDAHVNQAEANKTKFDEAFQEYIINSAWGAIWSRPHLTKRERSLITIALLAALGHDEELAMHIRATQNTGATEEDVKEVLLHTGIYAGVPVTNGAMKIAKKVYAALKKKNDE